MSLHSDLAFRYLQCTWTKNHQWYRESQDKTVAISTVPGLTLMNLHYEVRICQKFYNRRVTMAVYVKGVVWYNVMFFSLDWLLAKKLNTNAKNILLLFEFKKRMETQFLFVFQLKKERNQAVLFTFQIPKKNFTFLMYVLGSILHSLRPCAYVVQKYIHCNQGILATT